MGFSNGGKTSGVVFTSDFGTPWILIIDMSQAPIMLTLSSKRQSLGSK